MPGKVRGVFDLLAAVATVAAVMMLVRKGSRGPQLVAGIGAAFQAATVGTVGSTVSTSSSTSSAPTTTSAPYDPLNYV